MGHCCFVDCKRPLFVIDDDDTINVAQFCHIRGREPEAARHDAKWIAAGNDVDGYNNLVVMCYDHHHTIDDRSTRDRYTVAVLERMKLARVNTHNDFWREAHALTPVFEQIDELCDHLIANQAVHFDPDLGSVSPEEKIRVNKLPPEQERLIRSGLLYRSHVAEWMESVSQVNVKAPEKLRFRMRCIYNGLRAEGVECDQVIPIMHGKIIDRSPDNGSDATARVHAAGVLLAYFFEACDILERE